MLGVILSGGQSTRMGRDKGLMEFNGKKWSEIVRDKMVSLSIQTVISINSNQLVNYSKSFNRNDLVLDNPGLKIQGPLVGLLSAHIAYPQQDILIVACDMINIESIFIENLVDSYNKLSPEAIAFKGEYIEPLCAIYSSQGLKKILLLNNEGSLKRNSLINVLENLMTVYLPIKTEWQSAFKNFNRKEDLD
ncbi:MAG: molybdenum cofactor guanylyltransferase [Cyclobacteriaceae bacterium]